MDVGAVEPTPLPATDVYSGQAQIWPFEQAKARVPDEDGCPPEKIYKLRSGILRNTKLRQRGYRLYFLNDRLATRISTWVGNEDLDPQVRIAPNVERMCAPALAISDEMEC